MKKKITASLLCLAIILSSIPFAFSASGSATYAANDGYIYESKADPATKAIPEEFGTKAANGRVWTDKTVNIDGNGFKITLSALTQEYVKCSEDMVSESIGVDVAMAIDMTGSMKDKMGDKNGSKTYAMCKAVNDALEVIMSANEKNRAIIYTYSGSSGNGSAKLFLPLGHYTNTKWTNESNNWTSTDTTTVSGKFIDLSSSNTIKPNKNILCNGKALTTSTSVSASDGTCAQYGILSAVKGLCDGIKNETYTTERVPFFLFFTDGVCCLASKDWYQELPTKNTLSYSDNGTANITALTILSAAIGKQRLADAYKAYNAKGGKAKDIDVPWYNIGLIPEDSRKNFVKALMEPQSVYDETSDTGSIAGVKNSIANYTSASSSTYKEYAEWGKDGKYVYNTDYVFYADTQKDLDTAFESLSKSIAERSRVRTVPIVNKTVQGSELVANLTFTDVIGKGMKVDEDTITLIPADDPDSPIQGTKSGTEYHFTGYKTIVKIEESNNQQTVKTIIPPDEIGLFSFANASDLDNGEYISSQPVVVTYNVKVAENSDSDNLYSNAYGSTPLAGAKYFVLKDNPYYFDVEKDETGLFVSGTLKEAFASGSITAKEDNPTETTANVSVENFTDVSDDAEACDITNLLGNDGVLIPKLKITKTFDDEDGVVTPGQDVEYTIKIENLTDEDIEDIIIDDIIPEGTDFKSSDDFTEKTGGIEAEVDKVEAGKTEEIKFVVTVDDKAEDESVIPGNDPKVVSVDDTAITDTIKENEDLDLGVDATPYSVTYNWGSYTPADYSLPIDSTVYYNGDSFTADYNNISKNTVIEIKDTYGNVTETYTFLGWNKDSGTISSDNVELVGQWDHDTITLSNYKVTYSWTGLPEKLEAANAKPVDSTSYVNNQPYTVDKTYTDKTVVYDKDQYGNNITEYSFSGWDTADGKIPDADVEIKGEWSKKDITLDKYSVTYSWKGLPADLEASNAKPVDNNSYVNNQPYTVDTTYNSTSIVYGKDQYGNDVVKYTFSGWDTTDGNIPGKNVEIKGEWKKEDITLDKYSVTYSWTGLPEKFNSTTPVPVDSTSYINNQPYTVDTTYTTSSVVYDKDQYGNNITKYTFKGWDKTDGTIPGANVQVKGEWDKEDITLDKYSVTYSWTGLPADLEATNAKPVDNTAYVNNQPYTVDTTYTTSSVVYDKDQYGNNITKYTFSGWDKTNGNIPGANVEIKGEWEKEEIKLPNYKVTYSWTGLPADLEAANAKPVDNTAYVNNQPYTVDTTYTTSSIVYDKDQYGNNITKYTFKGWNKTDGNIPGADVEVKGEWEKEEIKLPTYKVTYSWTGLPEKLEATNAKPVDNTAYVNNQPYTVDTKYTGTTVVYDKDQYGNDIAKYTFSGWDKTSSNIPGANVEVKGEWVKTDIIPDKYHITYSFGSYTPDVTLPTDTHDYVHNEPYAADNTVLKSGDKFPVYDENNGLTGYEVFQGWDDNGGYIDDKDVTITAQWLFVPADSYAITYEWDGEAPVDVDPPTDSNTYLAGHQYTVKEVTSPHINADGKWTFEGWDTEDGTITGNLTIKGKWSKEEAKEITYDWGDFNPGKDLPTDDKDYYDGDEFKVDTDVIKEGEEFIDEEGNKWIFDGWDTEDGVIGDEDITIKPKWTKEEPKHITYEFTGDVPESAVLPTDDKNYYDGDEYTLPEKPEDVPHYDKFGNEDGRYVFKGWDDPNEGVFGETELKITGEWKYVPEEVPQYNVDFTDDVNEDGEPTEAEKVITNGDHIRIYPNGGDWTYGDRTYTGEEMARIIVNGDIDVPDPVRDGYVFKGWEVTEEDGELTLTAKWEEDKSIIPWIIGGVVIGGTAAAITAGAIVGGIIAGGTAAVVGGAIAAKAIHDKISDNNNNSDSDDQIPDTGSTSPKLAAFALVSSAAAAAYVILSRKKEED